MATTVPSSADPRLDGESNRWLRRLRPGAPGRDSAIAQLHALLLKAARFETARRAAALGPSVDAEDLAQQSADDALVAVLAKLEEFRGESRFTTWAYKFALYEAAVSARRQGWRGREIPLQQEGWDAFEDQRQNIERTVGTRETLSSVRDAIENELSPHQREVLVAVALNDVPIDVLAERLGKTRGALYKTLHDARRKLRASVPESAGVGEIDE